MALRKKKARRMSFTNNKIIFAHIFHHNNSSSSETPPDSVTSSSSKTAPTLSVPRFFHDLAGSGDEDNDNHIDNLKESSSSPSRDDGEVANDSDSFLRPIGSPCPSGSSIAA